MSLENGEIIIRNDLLYPEWALVVEGFDEEGHLLAHPLDGGIQYKISTSELVRFDVVTLTERSSTYDWEQPWDPFMTEL